MAEGLFDEGVTEDGIFLATVMIRHSIFTKAKCISVPVLNRNVGRWFGQKITEMVFYCVMVQF